jgi:protein phosphatase
MDFDDARCCRNRNLEMVRLYDVYDVAFRQISVDDVPASLPGSTVAAECGMLEVSGRRTSHLVTQALGGSGSRVNVLNPHVVDVKLTSSWTLLLCSDGLSDFVTEDDIQRSMRLPLIRADGLVKRALAAGGGDNISVVMARYEFS